MYCTKCPHCHIKPGDFMYADVCPHCGVELQYNTTPLLAPPSEVAPGQRSLPMRAFLAVMRVVES
jgi:hypothetical protein